jgi:threonylcarbamoyladenosine tRNA methylthiotransferase MtaB
MRIAITTLGCKINQYDSAVIESRLRPHGHSFVPFDERADFYILNTCTVTDRADAEARRLVRRAKRANPDARIVVTGCYAQVQPEEVSSLPGVDFVVGLNRVDDLVRIVRDPDRFDRRVAVADVKKERAIPSSGTDGLFGQTRAFLKIQEGCDFSCTYCIIPAARGRSRSLSPETVLREARSLSEKGFREIVLTGIHLGGYGRDLEPKTDLAELARKIADSGLVSRLRLSSLDPREVTEPLLRLMADSKIVCPHLHVCAQAGEDGVLKRMRRNYDTAYYRDLVARCRDRLPDAALGTDIIVGFPGETETDFERSYEYFASLPLTYFHVFPYSVRRGTAAAVDSGQVAPRVRKGRSERMRTLGREKKMEFYRSFIGRRVSVLIESAKPGGFHRGYSRNYLPVEFACGGATFHREVEVKIEGLRDGVLHGAARN